MQTSDVIARVKRQLGEPQVKVELAEKDYEDSLSNAATFYSRLKPKKVSRSTFETNGGNYIVLSEEDKVNLIDVVDCDYKNIIKSTFNYGGIIETPIIPYEWQLRSDRYVATFNKIAMDAKELAYDGDWQYDENTGRLYLSPPVISSVEVAYIITKIRTVEEIPSIDLDLFIKLVEAFCRDKLADIRGKYTGIPSPGGTLTMDAAEQRTRAQALKDEVKEALLNQVPPAGFLYG